ncbi:DUF695 domain-containing protein [Paraburkholderia hospita]|uniref:DUF695 domain-containing protein n=1 Tax=Paraburkholderia hospita TaxID=169430 RepID=UPI00027182E5|nr:DUF695 domain-containing protein [Paraburkholderia hospita]EUC20705.1 hypothetical protein PMI06_009886 [Burkholderia sp. BT03]SKC45639.1 Family of unknown function [Paraburkholderia hospita]
MSQAGSSRKWGTATSEDTTGGHTVIFRYVQDTVQDATRLSQPMLFRLVWRYESDTGMPTIEARERMDELEDALALALEADGFASLVLVSTGERRREWTYYAGPNEDFMSRLNRGLSSHPRFPIEIFISEEPDWETLNDFKRRVAS